MPLALLLYVACADPISITPSQAGCDEVTPEASPASTLEWEAASDGSIRVWRSNAYEEQTGLIFDPVVVVDGKIVEIHEAWTGGETADTYCYEPAVTFEGIAKTLQVRWFVDEGDTVPFDTVDVEAP